jgi:hypothetical protein
LIPQPDNFLFSEADGGEVTQGEDGESDLRGHGLFNRKGIEIELVSSIHVEKYPLWGLQERRRKNRSYL